jgi:hypothetical protein
MEDAPAIANVAVEANGWGLATRVEPGLPDPTEEDPGVGGEMTLNMRIGITQQPQCLEHWMPICGLPGEPHRRTQEGAHRTHAIDQALANELSRRGRSARAVRCEQQLHHRSDLSLAEIAHWARPVLAGWVRHYGRFHPSALSHGLNQLTPRR